jgi:hypothetical protein
VQVGECVKGAGEEGKGYGEVDEGWMFGMSIQILAGGLGEYREGSD